MNRVLGCLGLARRANKLSYGETALNDIISGKSCLVLIGKNASSNTQKRFVDKCKSHNTQYLMVDDSEELSNAIGKTNIKCFSINDCNFAEMIKEALSK